MSLRAILTLIGVPLALIALVLLVSDWAGQREQAGAAKACAAAAASAKPLDDCLPEVRKRLEADRQAQFCDAALLPSLRPEARFAAQQSCGAGTKRLIAQVDQLGGDRDDLARQLAETRDATAAAILRAEARAARSNEREVHARTVIDAAPRDAAGRIGCDAECLRRLAQ